MTQCLACGKDVRLPQPSCARFERAHSAQGRSMQPVLDSRLTHGLCVQESYDRLAGILAENIVRVREGRELLHRIA